MLIDVQKKTETREMATTEDTSKGAPTEEAKAEAYFNDLFALLSSEDWNRLLERVKDAKETLTLPESFRRLGSILAAASYAESVPLDLYTSVLSVAGNDAASYADTGLRTPFHMTLMYSDRPDVCRTLLGACPALVSMRDVEGLRGIDILTQKIVMKEEHLRYLKSRATTKDRQSLEQSLECARLVTICHGGERGYDLPMLHACCLTRSDIPLSLLEGTIRRYGAEQTMVQDSRGNTPLHYAAAHLPLDEFDDALPRVLRINQNAASIRNNQDEYPIDLAIQFGRRWESGCRLLLKAYPPAVLVHQACNSQQAKAFVYQLTQLSCYGEVYSVLQSNPKILL